MIIIDNLYFYFKMLVDIIYIFNQGWYFRCLVKSYIFYFFVFKYVLFFEDVFIRVGIIKILEINLLALCVFFRKYENIVEISL